MNTQSFARLIAQKYGAVRRARGAFLYTASGTRLTDLYLEGGRAILGWRGGQAFTVFKNVFSRGDIGISYETAETKQAARSINALFGDANANERRVAVFRDRASAFRTACALSEKTMFWRPWCSSNEGFAEADCILLVPPFPWGAPLYILAAKANLCAECEVSGEALPAPLAAAIARSVYDLKALLPLRSEKDWFTHDKVLSRFWQRRGPYLHVKADAVAESEYDAFVEKCLDCGVAISPDFNTPSIITPGLDAGVFKGLLALK